MNEEYLNLVRMPERQIKSFIYGIGVSCIFFNLSMFLLLRTMYSLYYVIYSSSILYGLATGSSHIAMHQAIFWPLCLILAAWTAALLSNSVLNMQYFSPKLWRISVCLMSVSSLCVAVYFLFAFGPVLYISYFLALLSILMNVYAAFIRLFSGYVPAIFLGLGWSVLFFGYALTFIGLYVIHFPPITWSAFVAYAIESVLFAIALTYRTRDSEQKAIQDKMHALSQLQKVVYSHQVEQIKNGSELESTMPTTSAHACVLSFGIMNGSKIKHIKAKAFFRNVFSRCNAIMSEGYDGMNLKANAYRIKEMGNGFLCSVGYPFQSMSINPANDSIDLAKRFADVLAEEADMLHSEVPIVCGIGIVLDTLTGFYPEAGTKEYDLYGQAIFLATCYQDMHKALTEEAQGRSVLIIQEVVYQSLDSSYRTGFIPMDLRELGVEVRDDPAATRLYYQFLGSQKAGGSKSLLKVV